MKKKGDQLTEERNVMVVPSFKTFVCFYLVNEHYKT